MITFALFGAGRIGSMHAENLVKRSDAKLLYVVDPSPKPRARSPSRSARRQATEEQAFGDPAVQAVLIASSTGSHADLSIAAAQAGKAIFCEKPVDLTLAKVEACIKAVKKAKVPMFVGFNRRFDPSFRALKKRLDAGAIGKVEQVIITNRDPGLPELRFLATSGGLFLDFTIHDFDMARWLLGEEPVEVFALGRGAGRSARADRRQGHRHRDAAAAHRRRARCATSTTRAARSTATTSASRCSARRACCAPGTSRPTSVERFGREATCADNPWPNFQTRYAAAYAAELSSFIHSVERRKPPKCRPKTAARCCCSVKQRSSPASR